MVTAATGADEKDGGGAPLVEAESANQETRGSTGSWETIPGTHNLIIDSVGGIC